VQSAVQFSHQRREVGAKRRPGVSKARTLTVAFEQRDAKLIFEAADAFADN